MLLEQAIALLRQKNIQPTPQRIAIVQNVLENHSHPTADEVWKTVQAQHPTVSRATVYNTLNLLVEKGLLRTQVIKEGKIVFDPHVELHHHFIDEESGEILDIPWDALKVTGELKLPGFEVYDFQVILHGRKKKPST